MAKETEPEGILNTRFIIVVALSIIIIASGGLGYRYLIGTQDPFPDSGETATTGDTVSIEYTGYFEDGTIFDTSLASVAENDVLYPKAESFTSKSTYQPLSFIIGNGDVIEGFEDGVINMRVNETKTVTVPPEKGYGEKDPDLITTISLYDTVPIFTYEYNITNFEKTYLVDSVVGTVISYEDWGWNATIFLVEKDKDRVVLKNEPYIGEVFNYNGIWHSVVTKIDSATNGGEITIKHLLDSSDINTRGTDSNGDFVITDVNPTAETATLDYNRDVVGKTLIFDIKVVSITSN